MRYYVAADVHGFTSLFRRELERAGYDRDTEPHKLVICGDAFDRGPEARAMQEYLLDLLAKDEAILVRGNHEDLFSEMVTVDQGLPVRHHVSNGTYGTALQLTGYEEERALKQNLAFAAAARETPYYTQIIPATVDYFETEHYLFVHGWIPCMRENGGYSPLPDWRQAGKDTWRRARWINGMDAAPSCPAGKTVLCGHWNCSWGHVQYEHRGSEFGPDADHSPYYGPGIIALDACTAHSGKLNIVVLED